MSPYDHRPIGYVEKQFSWVGDSEPVADTIRKALADMDEDMRRTHPGHIRNVSRVEAVKDGAGVQHYNLFVGFIPRVEKTPPLNPRNLNDAEHPQIGNAVEDHAIGMKEQRF